VDEALVLADRILCLNPDGTLGAAFEVNLLRPRDRDVMNEDDGFKALRADVTAYLMDVGIAAKMPETRALPALTPRHALPKAYSTAATSPIEARYLRYSQLHKVYATPKGPLTVVEDFNLVLKKGEFVSLIGHSGCGKSTVLTMTGPTPNAPWCSSRRTFSHG
jgi:nitrate/nitrite transport system ATP-binding protein